MKKVRFYYNTKSLNYERVDVRFKDRFLRFLSFVFTGIIFALVIVYVAYTYFDSPKEKRQKREIEQLTLQYEILNNRLTQFSEVLGSLQQRDDNIYRVIFEAEPIPSSIRNAGFGGVDRYQGLE